MFTPASSTCDSSLLVPAHKTAEHLQFRQKLKMRSFTKVKVQNT